MSVAATEPAPGKVNLCLFLGATRTDGRHELVTLFQSVDLADRLTIAPLAGAGGDQVVCAGVAGRNLVADALDALRAAGWAPPPVRVTIDKRIPVAAGMGGGSADAAALLRHAPRLAPVAPEVVVRIAAGLGADVPGQLRPGASLGTGAGEIVRPLAALPAHALVVIPQPFRLSTADVYREADRLGLARPAPALAGLQARLETWLSAEPQRGAQPPPELIVNDLQPAALSLRPELAGVLDQALAAGAEQAIVCGSGPTVIGVFWGADVAQRSARAAEVLRGAHPRAVLAHPVDAGVGAGRLSPAPNQ